jgi:transcriptional regulator with XRE-family HTH domain
MDTITATLAKRVEAARRDQGVAILPLSIATGIARTTLSRQLKGRSEFSAPDLVLIARHLGVPVEDWINDLGQVAA